ncbi:hypothetical protein DPMN_106780 [Dreissena polymorpha]|uniref:Uncharacterized protein n=1 Tax=Dreissena polymorpha TaxID=45954 RepID=A0A9D4K5P5_DREPO|nr:hypothetical protein DPMN_106780 [Dreissena polymorpha]
MLIIKNVIGEAFDNDSIEGIRTELKQRISLVSVQGMSGFVQFDEKGKRTNYSIILTELSAFSGEMSVYEFSALGVWLASPPSVFTERLQIRGRIGIGNRTSPFPLVGRTAKVVTILEKPFCMRKQ